MARVVYSRIGAGATGASRKARSCLSARAFPRHFNLTKQGKTLREYHPFSDHNWILINYGETKPLCAEINHPVLDCARPDHSTSGRRARCDKLESTINILPSYRPFLQR